MSYVMAIAAIHFYFVSYVMSLVEVPTALADEPDWIVGLVVGAMGIAGMITRPLVGVLVDSGNRRRWVRLGATGTIIAFIGYSFDMSPAVYVAFRALHGLSMGFFTTGLLAIVTSVLPSARRGLGMGVYQSSNAAANVYAAVMAIWIIDRWEIEWAFLVSALAAVIALLFGSLARDASEIAAGPSAATKATPRPASPAAPGAATSSSGDAGPADAPARLWISPTALLPAIVFLMITTPVGAMSAFLPLFAIERDLGNVGFFYSALAVSQLLARSTAGWLSDRFGRAAVVLPGLFTASAGLVLVAAAQSQSALLLAGAVFGLGVAATHTSLSALIVDRTPVRSMGSAMATYTMAWDVGQVFGSVILGVVAGQTSYGAVFAMTAVLPVVGVALFLARVTRTIDGRASSHGAAS
jgi:MFS family permease